MHVTSLNYRCCTLPLCPSSSHFHIPVSGHFSFINALLWFFILKCCCSFFFFFFFFFQLLIVVCCRVFSNFFFLRFYILTSILNPLPLITTINYYYYNILNHYVIVRQSNTVHFYQGEELYKLCFRSYPFLHSHIQLYVSMLFVKF